MKALGRRAVLVPRCDAPRGDTGVQQASMEPGHEVGWEAGHGPIPLPSALAKVLSAGDTEGINKKAKKELLKLSLDNQMVDHKLECLCK